MRRFGLLWWTYLLALLPLVIGSVIFFYWFYARRWYAHDAHIEFAAFLAITLYLCLGVVSLVLCGILLMRDRSKWYRILGPLFVLVSTWVMIDLYSAYHSSDERAFLRIDVKGSGITEVELWSSHFHTSLRADPNETDLVFMFMPTYTYDWGKEGSLGAFYSVDSVFIAIHKKAEIETFVLPFMSKGECSSLNQAEILALPRTHSMEERYGVPINYGD